MEAEEITQDLKQEIDQNLETKNLEEKVHMCYKLVDDLCHEIVYHKHEGIDYKIMKKEVISVITKILKGTI